MQNSRELVQCLIPLSPSVKEPFWIESAQAVATGLLLHYYADGKGFIEAIELIQGIPLPELLEGIKNSD